MKEDDYKAEWDANTLIEANTIKSDKSRFKKAISKVNEIASTKEKEAKAARSIAKSTPKKNTQKKGSIKQSSTKKVMRRKPTKKK